MRSKMFSLFPLAWITAGSGGSRKRPVCRPLALMKLPQWSLPAARSNPMVPLPNEPYSPVTLPVGFVFRPERVVTLTISVVLLRRLN